MLAVLLAFSCEIHEKKQPIIKSGVVIHKLEHRGQLTLLVQKDSVIVEVPVTKEEFEKAQYRQEVQIDTVRDEYNQRLKYKLIP